MYQLTLEWQTGSQLQQAMLTWDPAELETLQTLGRSPDCTVTLLDPARHISGRHAGISFKAETQSFWLRNLTRDRISPQQPNPIWVNGVKVIGQEIPLTSGCQIQLGKLILMVTTIGIPTPTPPVPLSPLSQVKCSRDSDPHLLPISYIGQNCPYCGQLVLSSTVISTAPL
ncbi:MAG: FHA domain-containing protein [Synechococcaceae cyanobacterium RM1_1_27]|nr:FHA domain-containing protein [Synechococcaceae cyanobacterium RM1_1_27]